MRLKENNEFHVIYRSFTLFFIKMGTKSVVTGDKLTEHLYVNKREETR